MVEPILEELIVEERSRIGYDLDDPNYGADQDGCFNSSNLREAQRIRHGQIPVQRYTAEEGDADVDISVEDEAEQLAALLTVDPVVTLQEVVDPERKSGDIQEVRHRQVDQVDAELVALAYLHVGSPQGHAVSGKPQNNDYDVERGLEELVHLTVHITE